MTDPRAHLRILGSGVATETDHAYAFFRALRQFLNAAMPGPKEMADSIDQIVKSGRGRAPQNVIRHSPKEPS